MTDSMKFGPEWLRNMSSDMGNSGGVGGGGGGGGSSSTGAVGSGGGSNNNFSLSTSSSSSGASNNIGGHHNNFGGGDGFGVNNNNNSNSSLNNNSGGGLNNSSVGGGGAGTNSQPLQQPRYQLAEFRYSREEMLSLFARTIRLPEILPKFKKLFIADCQGPLALTPSTEDDVAVKRMVFFIFFLFQFNCFFLFVRH